MAHYSSFSYNWTFLCNPENSTSVINCLQHMLNVTNIREVFDHDLYHMTLHFSCSGREKKSKNILGPKKVQKGPKRVILGQNFQKKWKFFKNFFFQFEWFWAEKTPKKRWKIFLLTKLVWHFVIFGQKMRILDFKEFWRFHGFDDYLYNVKFLMVNIKI